MYCYFGGLPLWIQGKQIEPTLVTLALLLLLVFRLETGHSGTQYFHFHLVGNTKLNRVTLDPHNCAEESAICDYLVPVLEIALQFRGLLTLTAHGSPHEEIHDKSEGNKKKQVPQNRVAGLQDES